MIQNLNKIGDIEVNSKTSNFLQNEEEYADTTLEDVIAVVRNFAKDKNLEQNFNRGFNKSVPPNFNFTTFNKNLKLLFKSTIASELEDDDDVSFVLLNDFVDASSAIDSLLTHVKFSSDNKAILLDIIGYILKYFSKTYD